jgi:hypothetical protein
MSQKEVFVDLDPSIKPRVLRACLLLLCELPDDRARLQVLSLLNQHVSPDATQICGYCLTAYRLQDDAAACSRRCRQNPTTTTDPIEAHHD